MYENCSNRGRGHGSIYGGRLSLHNEVYMVDTSAAVVDHISREGICLEEPDGVHVYRPRR